MPRRMGPDFTACPAPDRISRRGRGVMGLQSSRSMSAQEFAEKKASSREHFDRWSREYERDQVSRWLQELQLEALAALGPGRDDRLLDVGCGSGAAVRAAAR